MTIIDGLELYDINEIDLTGVDSIVSFGSTCSFVNYKDGISIEISIEVTHLDDIIEALSDYDYEYSIEYRDDEGEPTDNEFGEGGYPNEWRITIL